MNICPYCKTENKDLIRLVVADGTRFGIHHKFSWMQNGVHKQVPADPSVCINCGGLFIRQEKLLEINKLLEEN